MMWLVRWRALLPLSDDVGGARAQDRLCGPEGISLIQLLLKPALAARQSYRTASVRG
jgi:hypothetical protein